MALKQAHLSYTMPRPPKTAVVVIDMYEDSLTNMRSATGNPASCHTADVTLLISEARRLGLPIFLFREPGRRIVPGFIDAAGECGVVLTKQSRSAFGQLDGAVDLDRVLRTAAIVSLVISGFNLSCCVRFTTEDAIARKYDVLTSNEMLFGSNAELRDPRQLDQLLLFYEYRTQHYPRASLLQSALRDIHG